MQAIVSFFKQESSGGITLMFAAVAALILANSPLSYLYSELFATRAGIFLGNMGLDKPLVLWINDGLMAVFFFLVGLELKREVLEGELSQPSQIILPAMAAVGGIIFPALVYAAINFHDPSSLRGWAIPTATDIAFALGVLALLGKNVPISLKIFLTTLAIIDDIGAILIIALFYTANLSLLSLMVVAFSLTLLFIMNRRGVDTVAPYLLVGMVLWTSVLQSGVHATLAGVTLALFIPMKDRHGKPLARTLEHDLHSAVAFGVLPIFAVANCGVPLTDVAFGDILHSVPLGIILGLLVGKPLGVLLMTYIAVKFKWATLPENTNWLMIIGVSFLTGIGFTMSLFIGSLAFEHGGPEYSIDERLGILLGSVIAAIVGVLILRQSLKTK
jgi:Na+:H+ antiporter, NhaA family